MGPARIHSSVAETDMPVITGTHIIGVKDSMMKRLYVCILIVVGFIASVSAETRPATRLFTTSRCFDLIASLQYFDKIKNLTQFSHLASDSAFIQKLQHVNDNVTASKLCNLYSSFGGDKDNADNCVTFFREMVSNDSLAHTNAGWIENIIGLQPELAYCLSRLYDAGYSDYWDNEVKPVLERYINSYPVSDETLDGIHDALTEFSGSEVLPQVHSNIYILNIDNAFNLSDESFCCTPLLLDPELEKKFRLDFLNVYTHENLHRLSISEELMKRLDELMSDDFYREKEIVARSHNEGRNEAFVVASEVFISHNIGRRDIKGVYDEFNEYVDGSLVLAPIIYVHLLDKGKEESLNDFILRLFDNGTIKVGKVEAEYNKAMSQIKNGKR